MNLAKNIFRAYDIRGVYPSELHEETAEHIGKAIGTLVKRKVAKNDVNIVVGHDSRPSSPSLNESFIKGILSTGCNVTDTGLSLTPIIHFLVCIKDFDAGIEVTASHNPIEYNGFRLDHKNAFAFTQEEILCLYDLITKEDYETGEGQLTQKDLNLEYVEFIKSQFKFDKKFRVVINCGYGTASVFAQGVFSDVGINIDPIYCRIDPEFPLGVPDPEDPAYMTSLSDAVLTNNADLGVTFDEDSDRAGFVDENGKTYGNDIMLLLFAHELLKDNKNKEIIYDVKCSQLLEDLVPQWGGIPKMIRTGHAFFVEQVRKAESIGGEYSGHMYFADRYFGYDDGLYTALRLIELMESKNMKLSELMKNFPVRVNTPEIKIAVDDKKKFEIVEAVKNEIYKQKATYKNISTIDGIRVAVSDSGWFLIRPSNTNPYLSIRAEGENNEEVSSLVTTIIDLLRKVGVDVNDQIY